MTGRGGYLTRGELLRLRGSLDFARDDGAFLTLSPPKKKKKTALLSSYTLFALLFKKTLLFIVLVYPCQLQRLYFLTTLILSNYAPTRSSSHYSFIILSISKDFPTHYTRFILVLSNDLPQFLLLFLLFSSLFLSLTLLFLFPLFLFIFVIICYIYKFLLLLILFYLNFLPLYSIFLILSKTFSFSLHFYFLHTPKRLYALTKLALYNFTPTIFFLTTLVLPYFPNKKRERFALLFLFLSFVSFFKHCKEFIENGVSDIIVAFNF